MPYIHIDAQSYEFSELKKSNIGKHPALVFCHYWLNGQKIFLLQTSGSTGEPKPITVSREQMMVSAAGTIEALGLSSKDKALVCLNTSYIGGMMMMVRCMVLGMDMLIVPPEGNPFEHIPESFHPTFAALVPMQAIKIMELAESCEILNRMKAIIIGGAAVDMALEEALQAVKSPVFSTYGMTETVSHIALRRLNGPHRSEYYELLEHLEITQNEQQCLKVRGAVTRGRWLETNDLVEIAEGGQKFKCEGRADLTINSGGIKIPIVTVERTIAGWLVSMRQKALIVVVGMPDASFGEKVTWVVEAEVMPSWAEDLNAYLKEHLTKYQVPKQAFCISKIPLTPTGKPDRKALVKLLEAGDR